MPCLIDCGATPNPGSLSLNLPLRNERAETQCATTRDWKAASIHGLCAIEGAPALMGYPSARCRWYSPHSPGRRVCEGRDCEPPMFQRGLEGGDGGEGCHASSRETLVIGFSIRGRDCGEHLSNASLIGQPPFGGFGSANASTHTAKR